MSVLSNVELVLWSLPEEARPTGQERHVLISDCRQALTTAGLKPERAEPVAESTAFRRAIARSLEKGFFSRYWTNKEGVLCCKVLQEYVDEFGSLQTPDHSEYALLESGPHQKTGGEPERIAVVEAYQHATTHYTGSDISGVIKDIIQLDGLGAYSPKKNGGVYFVPLKPEAPDMLDKIEGFCNFVGVRFLRYQVPNLAGHRDEIAEAVFDGLSGDLEQHNTAITAYSGETKPGVLTNRRESLNATESLINSLASLLNGKAPELTSRIAQLRTLLGQKEQEIEASKAKARAAKPRLIEID